MVRSHQASFPLPRRIILKFLKNLRKFTLKEFVFGLILFVPLGLACAYILPVFQLRYGFSSISCICLVAVGSFIFGLLKPYLVTFFKSKFS